MCGTCGCNSPLAPLPPISKLGPVSTPAQSQHVRLETSLLAANDRIAEQNRRYFMNHSILALNIVSGPGAGKTTLLEATARYFASQSNRLHVIEGDQQTDHDAQRVRKAGATAYQINTGHLCHLEAFHIQQAFTAQAPAADSILVIENVGNLVCPATFDLGEQLRIVVISTPEGDDKPLKYPDILANADLLIISKADLSPYVDFNIQACIENARRIRPGIEALVLSAKTGEGLETWLHWLDSQRQQFTQEASSAEPLSSDLR